jgi:hypothetical protein
MIFQECEILGCHGRDYKKYVFLDVTPFSLVFDGGRGMVAAGTLFVAVCLNYSVQHSTLVK